MIVYNNMTNKKDISNGAKLATSFLEESYFRHPVFMEAVQKYFDIEHDETRRIMLNINETDQNSVLTSLTSKLYDNIVDKVDDIDFGDIPKTKGDITKLPNFDKLVDCINIMEKILIEYKQDTKPVLILSNALEHLSSRKMMFERAFKFNIELPMVMYSTIALSIISSISFMIATCIEFIKTPTQENFDIILDKVALSKTKQNLLFVNLNKFNDSCKNGDFDKAMDYIINNKIKNFTGIAAIGTVSTIAIIGVILNIIPILRELIFFFYYSKTRVSDYFDIQADLLQMNAYNLEHNSTKDTEDKAKVINKQLKLVELFRSIANKLSISNKNSEVKTTKEIVNNDKKFKSDEVLDAMPDSASSALF